MQYMNVLLMWLRFVTNQYNVLINIIMLYVAVMWLSCDDALFMVAVMLSTDEHTKIIKEKETALDKWKVNWHRSAVHGSPLCFSYNYLCALVIICSVWLL